MNKAPIDQNVHIYLSKISLTNIGHPVCLYVCTFFQNVKLVITILFIGG